MNMHVLRASPATEGRRDFDQRQLPGAVTEAGSTRAAHRPSGLAGQQGTAGPPRVANRPPFERSRSHFLPRLSACTYRTPSPSSYRVEAGGIEPPKDSPGQCVLPVGVAFPSGGMPRRVPARTTPVRADHVEGDVTHMEGALAPKVCAGKVVTDRRKTRAASGPEWRPRSVGGAVKRNVGCLEIALLRTSGRARAGS
jgi:hypothetical protein